MPRLLALLRLWFSTSGVVDRTTYAASGAGLAALKYAVDALLVYTSERQVWTPLDYLEPSLHHIGALAGSDQG